MKQKIDFITFFVWSSVLIFIATGLALYVYGFDFASQGTGGTGSTFAGIVTLICALPVIIVFNILAYFVFKVLGMLKSST